MDNQSQEDQLEEESIYTKNIGYKDSLIMGDFPKHSWEDKWVFAEKFSDNRLKYFAAKHIYRNSLIPCQRKYLIIFMVRYQKNYFHLRNKNLLQFPQLCKKLMIYPMK